MLPLWSDAHSDVRVVRLTDAVEIETLICFFEEIAIEQNWKPDGALRLWQNSAVYFALEKDGMLIGGLQLVVEPDLQGRLPYQSVWPEVQISDASQAAHAAILALQEEYRGRPLLWWKLVVEAWRYAAGHGIPKLSLEVSPRKLALYRRMGWPLEIQSDLRMHWGASTYLCALGIPAVAEAMLRRAEHSRQYQQIVAQGLRLNYILEEDQASHNISVC